MYKGSKINFIYIQYINKNTHDMEIRPVFTIDYFFVFFNSEYSPTTF